MQKTVLPLGVALDDRASYSGATLPDPNDYVTFTSDYQYGAFAFTLNNSSLSIGSFVVLTTQPITISASKTLTLNADPGNQNYNLFELRSGTSLTYGGTGSIVLGISGSVTTAVNSQATINSAVTGNYPLTKYGNGTLTLGGNNTYTGGTTINGGVLNVGSANALNSTGNITFSGGTLQYSAANQTDYSSRLRNSFGAYRIDTNGQNVNFANGLTNNAGFVKLGTGTLNLQGEYTFGDNLYINGGILAIRDGAKINLGDRAIVVDGGTSASPATLNLNNSTVDTNVSAVIAGDNGYGAVVQIRGDLYTSHLYLGDEAIGRGTYTLNNSGNVYLNESYVGYSGTGTFNQSAGTVTTGGFRFSIGYNIGSLGTYNLSDTGILSAGDTSVGRNGVGVFNQTGGTFTVTTGGLSIGGGVYNTGSFTTSGTYNLSGRGILTTPFTTLGDGDNSTAVFNQSGQSTHTTGSLAFGYFNTAANATYNLDGGTLATGAVFGYLSSTSVKPGTSTFNFNGGTLKATQDTSTPFYTGVFFGGINVANVRAGGARIDSGVFNITVSQPLLHSTVSGDPSTDGGLTKLGTGRLTLTGANTYAGPTTISAGELHIGTGGTSGSLGTNTGTITDNGLLTFDRSDNLTLANFVTGTGGLAKFGAGTLTVTGNNNYTGGTTFGGGTLNVGSAGALGSTGPLLFLGGTLQYSAANQTDYSARFSTAANQIFRFDLNGRSVTFANGFNSPGGSLTVLGGGNLLLTGNSTYSGTTTIGAGTFLQVGNQGTSGSLGTTSSIVNNGTLAFYRSDTVTLPAPISGTGNLTQYGTNLILTGANTYMGQTNITNGTLQIGAGGTSGSLGLGGAVSDNGTLIFNRSDAVVVANVINGFGDLVQSGSGTVTLLGNNTYAGMTTIEAGTLQVGAGGAAGSLGTNTGPITDNGTLAFNRSDNLTLANVVIGTGGLTKLGTNTLTLTANNTYAGATTISAGTLQVGAGGTSGSLGTSTGTIFNNGTLAFNRSDSLSVANVISGTGSLTKLGANTLTLSGNNTYSGGTAISVGTLQLGSAMALGNGGTISFGTGTLQYSGGSQTDYSARFSTAARQNYRIDTNGQNVTFASGLTSSGGTLTKLGAGTLTLAGSNTILVASNSGGTTTVSAGTLAVSGDLLTGLISVNGGAFDQSGGTVNTFSQRLLIDNGGTYNLSGDSSSLTTGIVIIGSSGSGTFNQSGGNFSTTNRALQLGNNPNATSTYNLSGPNNVTLTTGGIGVGVTGPGIFNQSGGSVGVNSLGLYVGQSGYEGTYNQTGGSVFTGSLGLYLGFGGSRGTYNLDGGMLTVGFVEGDSGTSAFHFNGGTLQASGSDNPGAATNPTTFFAGTAVADVRVGGAVIDTQNFNVTVAQNLVHNTASGAASIDGGLTKLGVGTLTLGGASTYTGNTTVSAGTLLAANTSGSATGSGAVLINGGGTLGGSGTIAGPVAIASGGTLLPGTIAVPGRLTLGDSVVLNTGSTLAIELGGTTVGTFGQIQVGAVLTLGGNLSVTAVNGFALAVGQTFVIVNNTSNTALVGGAFANAPGGIYTDAAGDRFQVNYQANVDGGLVANDVMLTVVPEPSTWALLLAGAFLLGVVLRRRGGRIA